MAIPPSRLHYLDHLRVSLVILVIIHHLALVYGASAPFYYVEPPPITQFRVFQGFLVFALINQSFFMGALFLLAGYFTPGSYDRKGAASFLKNKLLRFGIPLVVFLFILNPVSELGSYLMPAYLSGLEGSPALQDYPAFIGLGPLWFVAMLLIFNIGYLVWRVLLRRRSPRRRDHKSALSLLWIGVFSLALAGVSYLMRVIVPLGASVGDFPTLAYLPQYLSFFIIGIITYREDWVRSLPSSFGLVGAAMALGSAFFLFPLSFSGKMFSLSLTSALNNALGNGHWQSAVYSAWDSLFSVGITLTLLTIYRRLWNKGGGLGGFLSKHSYSVYLIHIPMVVYLCYLIRDIDLTNVPMFFVATAIIIPLCFAVAFLIRMIPGLSKIL